MASQQIDGAGDAERPAKIDRRKLNPTLKRLGIDPDTFVVPTNDPEPEPEADIELSIPLLTDSEWAAIEPLLPGVRKHRSHVPPRQFVDVCLWCAEFEFNWALLDADMKTKNGVRQKMIRYFEWEIFDALAANLAGSLDISPDTMRRLQTLADEAAAYRARIKELRKKRKQDLQRKLQAER